MTAAIDANAALQDPPAALLFTDAAARKVGDLIRGEGNPKLMLRVFVQGGGCSGLQYGFEFDEQLQDGDTCIENQGVKLIVDPMSVQYLTGAEIDYREGLDGAQFVIRNPNLWLRLVLHRQLSLTLARANGCKRTPGRSQIRSPRRPPSGPGRTRRRRPREQQFPHGGGALLSRAAGHHRPPARDGAPGRRRRGERPHRQRGGGTRAGLSRALRPAAA